MAGAAVLVLAAVGCGIHPSEQATFQPDERVPFALLEPTTTSTSTVTPADAVLAQLCLIDDTGAVRPLPRRVPAGFEIVDLAKAIARGPSPEERQAGWTTALPSPELVATVTVGGGVADVDLTESFTSMPTDDQLKAVTQLVCTLTGQPGVGQVQFTVSGSPVAVPRGDGSTTSDAVSRDVYDNLIRDNAGAADPLR